MNHAYASPNALTLSIVSAADPAEFFAFLKSNALLLFFLRAATAKKWKVDRSAIFNIWTANIQRNA